MSAPMAAVKLAELRSQLDTVEYQIQHLTRYYSYLQVRIWRSQRKALKGRIKALTPIVRKSKREKTVKPYWWEKM